MPKKYTFVRMPTEIYKRYLQIRVGMEKDISKITGKQTKLTMPKVFRAVAFPGYNENYIQVDINKLVKLAREKQK